MAKYCDTKLLEFNWFLWHIAELNPILEKYRQSGQLWTKLDGLTILSDKKLVVNSSFVMPSKITPIKYCILLDEPYYIEASPIVFDDLPSIADIEVVDTSNHDESELINNGYFKEQPIDKSWEFIAINILNICVGTSGKFNQYDENDRHDLVYDACAQILSKIKRRVMKFTPGKAPVFNLCTTAIIHVMYSIVSRHNRLTKNMMKFVNLQVNKCQR